MRRRIFLAMGGLLLLASLAPAASGEEAPAASAEEAAVEAAVEKVLDALHGAASEADAATYWGLFASEAIFFGTDPGERWTLDEFRSYADPVFESGRGWTYRVESRHVFPGPSGDVAWFDEVLSNARYGECRGTGVLVRRSGGWKIVQYNLSIPIPNHLALEVVDRIREE